MPQKEKPDGSSFLGEIRERQRNIVWPDTMRNGRSVDALLWKGSRDATTVQRVGIAIFGLCFLVAGLGFAYMAYLGREIILAAFAAIPTLLGLRLLRNVFRR
jgi:hypothetical protein